MSADDASQKTQRARAKRQDGQGDVLLALAEVGKLPLEERRAELLKRLDVIWESAMGQTYTTKKGEQRAKPELMAALKVVEVADAMLVEAEGKQQKRANLLELAMFKTPERKAG